MAWLGVPKYLPGRKISAFDNRDAVDAHWVQLAFPQFNRRALTAGALQVNLG